MFTTMNKLVTMKNLPKVVIIIRGKYLENTIFDLPSEEIFSVSQIIQARQIPYECLPEAGAVSLGFCPTSLAVED